MVKNVKMSVINTGLAIQQDTIRGTANDKRKDRQAVRLRVKKKGRLHVRKRENKGK